MRAFLKQLALAIVLLAAIPANCTEPVKFAVELYNAGFPQSFDFLAPIASDTHNGLVVERSSDLIHWERHFNLCYRTTNLWTWETVHSRGQLPSTEFYRMTSAPQAPTNMLQQWQALGITHYKFRFYHYEFWAPGQTATLTVQDGKIVAIEDARDRSGNPIANPDISEFRTIEQLFDILNASFTNFDTIAVRFDPNYFFPTWYWLDIVRMVDDETEYAAWDFVPLP